MAFFNTSEAGQIQSLFSMLSQPDAKKVDRIKLWLEGQKKLSKPNPLNVLRREFSYLRGFDDKTLVSHLSNSLNQEEILKQLSQEQRDSLFQAQPATAETEGQPTGQEAPSEQAILPNAAEPSGSIPSIPTASGFQTTQQPRRVVIIQNPEEESAKAAEGEEAKSMEGKTEQAHGQPVQSTPSIPRMPQTMGLPSAQVIAREQPLRFQTGWRNSLKTGLSNAGMFAKQNGGKIIQGLRGMAGDIAGGAVRGGGNMLVNGLTGNFPGQRGLVSRFGNLRGAAARGQGQLAKVGKSRLKWVILGMLLFGGVFGLVTSSNPTGEPVSTTGTGGSLSSCDFTAFNILSTNAVDDNLLKKYTDRALATGKVKKGEQTDLLLSRAKYIRDQAQAAGLNPAIFLGYWESESAFSDYTYPGVRPGSDLGCDPTNRELKTFEDSVLCAVGKSQISNSRTSQCAVSKDFTSEPCQKISFQQSEGVKLPISTFKDFLDSYGSKVSDPNNAGSDAIVKKTIMDLGLVTCTAASANCTESATQAPPPTYTQLEPIGETAKNKDTGKTTPINAFQLGNGPIHVAIVGGMNGDQEQSGIDMVNAIKDAFKTGTYSLPPDLTLYLVPLITPDSKDGFNNRGQDINRNFNSVSVPGGAWSRLGCSIGRYTTAEGSYLTSCQDDKHDTKNDFSVYCQTMAPGAPNSTNQFTCAPNKTGINAFSEKETLTVLNLIDKYKINTVISYRAPYNNITSSNAPPGQKLPGVDELANLFDRELKTQYGYQQYFTQYPVPGQFMDWLQAKGVKGVEIELPPPADSLDSGIKTKNLQTIQKALNSLSKITPPTQGSCPLISCPLSKDGSGSFTLTCGTALHPTSSNNCGHGVPPEYPKCVEGVYESCPNGGFTAQLKSAIDVRPAGCSFCDDSPVYFPFVNGQPVQWTKVSGPIPLYGFKGEPWGVRIEYTTKTTDGKDIRIDLTHLDINSLKTDSKNSGDLVGKTLAGLDGPGSHLHVVAALNGTWLDSISEAHICTQ